MVEVFLRPPTTKSATVIPEATFKSEMPLWGAEAAAGLPLDAAQVLLLTGSSLDLR